VSATRVAVITSGFPRRSETFALHELLALDRAGMLAGIFATKPGDGTAPHPGSDRLLRSVRVLGAGSAPDQGDEVAGLLRDAHVTGVHGYFAHAPGAVAAEAARRLGIPFGFGVHARDARKIAPAELAARARAAACVITCNEDAAREVARAGAGSHLVRHGVDLDRFRARPTPAHPELRLLAVGRLVEKKGFHVLLDAVQRLAVPYRLRIVGDGPERGRLARDVRAAGLEARVELAGALTHARLPAEYAAADIVVVPSVADASGDRDGLPNVALEAMASARAVVASDVGALSTAVLDGETGLLVHPDEPAALAQALGRLAADDGLRNRFGRCAREHVEHRFELGACTRRLCEVLGTAYA
jgi:glycosyltransferase involved in cell wall biosynthesis